MVHFFCRCKLVDGDAEEVCNFADIEIIFEITWKKSKQC